MKSIELIGYLAAICTTVAYIPQLITIFKTKSVKDVSFIMYVIMLIGVLLWLVYGILTNSYPMIISSVISSLLIISMLVLKIKWR